MKMKSALPRVALVSDAIYPYHRGGKEVRYHELVSRLAERAELHVYTMNWWNGPRVLRKGPVTYHAVCRGRPLYAGSRRSIPQAVFFTLGCLRLLVARFDVLEADHMPYLQIPVLRAVATLRHKRLVVTWHEVWGREYWCQYLGRVGTLAWLLEWCVMRLPHHIIAASPQTAERLASAMGARAKVTTAPNGIDLASVRKSLGNEITTDIVLVNRLLPHKRVDMLLESLALLQDGGVKVSCRIIGDGPEGKYLRERAGALGIEGIVEFRSDVQDQESLYCLLKSSSVFVLPSAREGFGIAVLEAIACGLPVVTTSTPDNLAQHLVANSDRGVVCEPSARALAETIRKLVAGSSGLRSPMLSVDTWLDQYSWDATVEKVAAALAI